MSGHRSFAISCEAEAARALEYFNGFHDGFIKRMLFVSQDRIDEDLSQTCSGVFDVEIDFAHYNYAAGAEPFHPHNQLVRGQFRNVQDVFAEFRNEYSGNTIIRLSIAAGNRRRGGQTGEEPCLELHLGRHYLLEAERRYEFRETRMFTFTDATFAELPVSE